MQIGSLNSERLLLGFVLVAVLCFGWIKVNQWLDVFDQVG